jgi:hypothetical protein
MVRTVFEDEVADTQPQKRAVGAGRTSDALQLKHIHSKSSTCGRKGRTGILAAVDGSMLYSPGARLNELAPLTATDVITDAATDIVSINIKEDQERGCRLNTIGSARVVHVHPELTRIGFLSS